MCPDCVVAIYDRSRLLETRRGFLMRQNDNNPAADAELWSSVRVIDAKGFKLCWHWTGSSISKMWACSLGVGFKSEGNWKVHVVMSLVLTLWLMNYYKRRCFGLRSPGRWINHKSLLCGLREVLNKTACSRQAGVTFLSSFLGWITFYAWKAMKVEASESSFRTKRAWKYWEFSHTDVNCIQW